MTGGIETAGLIRPPDNYIVPAAQPVRAVLPHFKQVSTRTLIVVDESGPIGVLRLQDINDLDESELDEPARAHAVSVPVFERSVDVATAQTQARSAAGVEWLPVVNDNGRLAGVVAYDDLAIAPDAATAGSGAATIRPAVGGESDVTIEAGMGVYGSDGGKLGEVDRVVLDGDRAIYVVIKYGLIRHGRKRLPVTDIASVENGKVHLEIPDEMFDQLPGLEE